MNFVRSQDQRDLLREGCAALGVSLGASQEDKVLGYLDLVYVWNRAAGLTTIPPGDAVRLHALDSLAVLESVEAGPCLDLGTGAGLPGAMLAIADPSRDYVLVESNRRRSSFLLEAARVLALPNVRVVHSAVEELPVPVLYPTVVSRAFRPPAEFLAIATRFVGKSGRIILMVADFGEEALLAMGEKAGLKLDRRRHFHLPGGGEPRTIAAYGLRN